MDKFSSENLLYPRQSVGIFAWLRKNLFSSYVNGLMTVFILWLLWLFVPPFLDWALFSAHWAGDGRTACEGDGACWVFVASRIDQFLYGFYPEASYWRPNLAGVILLALLIPLFFKAFPWKRWLGLFTLLVYPFIAYALIYGGWFGLDVVETSQWGGLMLTLILASVGIVASLPLGILLALGRRSKMPLFRSVCIVYIEFWRGVPLITVLFMASVMLPLFFPEGTDFDKLLRALVGITLFQAAYMAEVIRGGLQAIPKGQYEAAAALGLNYPKSMCFIILPQALKLVIPGIVNTFIALFKDTTLVLIIGLLDLLAIIQLALTGSSWLGYDIEGYLFAGAVFWIFCFAMSRYSIALEAKLETGHRNDDGR